SVSALPAATPAPVRTTSRPGLSCGTSPALTLRTAIPSCRLRAHSLGGSLPSAAALAATGPPPTPLLDLSARGSSPTTGDCTKRSHKTGTIRNGGDGAMCHDPHSLTS